MPTSPHFLSSGDVLADRRYNWARELEARGDVAGAADLLVQTLERVPDFAAGWFALGELRARLGDEAGAIDAWRRTCAADPQDRHGASLHLARLGANAVGGAMPQDYVRTLFDQYSERFDGALTAGLDYRGPEILLRAVEAVCARTGRAMLFADVLDLGCGTGLAGGAFRPFAHRMTGVDLSVGMIAQARAKGLYDRLETSDVQNFLAAADRAESCDLILAADVFVYLGDLAPVFVQAARVLTPAGLLAFTAETHAGEGLLLRDTLRYAHGAAHIRAALEGAQLEPLHVEHISFRTEKGAPVPGLVVIAGRSDASIVPPSTAPSVP